MSDKMCHFEKKHAELVFLWSQGDLYRAALTLEGMTPNEQRFRLQLKD